MFQENIVYSFTLRDNITLSDIHKGANDQEINTLMNNWDLFNSFPRDLDIFLNKNFNLIK